MADAITCPGCGKRFHWNPQLAGKQVQCVCGNSFQVPESPQSVEVPSPPSSDLSDLLDDPPPGGDLPDDSSSMKMPAGRAVRPGKNRKQTGLDWHINTGALLSWGSTCALLGIGSFLLPMLGIQFKLLVLLGADKPIVGLVLAVAGAILLFASQSHNMALGGAMAGGVLVLALVVWTVTQGSGIDVADGVPAREPGVTEAPAPVDAEPSGRSSPGGATRRVGKPEPLARPRPEPPAEEDRSYVAFPSAGLRLRQPEGFQRASRFDGFEQASTQSSVMISVIPGPYAKVTEGFSSPTLMASRKMSVESRFPIDIGGLRGELVDLTQSLPTGAVFRKWIAVFGDDSKTTMITAAFPEEHGEDLSERLKATVLSAKLDAGSPSRSPANVGFEIAASGKMKRAGAVGKSLLFTKDGVMPVKEPTDPLFVAAVGTAAVSAHDHEEFARQRLEATVDTQIQSVTSEVKVEIDGLEGIELKADAKDKKSGAPMRIYQVVLFEGGSYFLMQGLVGAELGEEYLGKFEAMAHSLSRKQSAHAERAAAMRRQMKDARRRFRQPLESATDGEPDFGERQALAMDLDPIAESLDAPQQPIAQLSYQRSDVKSTEVVGSSSILPSRHPRAAYLSGCG